VVRNLTRLDLSGNQLGEASARALAESPYLDRLKTLGLPDEVGSMGGEAGRELLRQRFGNRCPM
jgi:hypothetical protein